jgi:hypothetical protein
MPKKYNPPILRDKTTLIVLRDIAKEKYLQTILFSLAYSNRILWTSAIRIRLVLQLDRSLNTLTVRYLLLLYFTTLARKDKIIPTYMLEKNDYFKIDKKRLFALFTLTSAGLATMSLTKRGKDAIEITPKGVLAVMCVIDVIDETTRSYPRKNNMERGTTIEPDCNIVAHIRTEYTLNRVNTVLDNE